MKTKRLPKTELQRAFEAWLDSPKTQAAMTRKVREIRARVERKLLRQLARVRTPGA